MKRKTTLTIEIDRVLTIRGATSDRRGKCEACGEVVPMITVDEAAKLAHIGSRSIYQMVEANRIHFIETSEDLLLICFNSISRSVSKIDLEDVSNSTNLEDDQDG
jgi:excisionase family DNA binding protein